MKSKSLGDKLVSPDGKEVTIIDWLPDKKMFVPGKWLVKDEDGNLERISSVDLENKGYNHKQAK